MCDVARWLHTGGEFGLGVLVFLRPTAPVSGHRCQRLSATKLTSRCGDSEEGCVWVMRCSTSVRRQTVADERVPISREGKLFIARVGMGGWRFELIVAIFRRLKRDGMFRLCGHFLLRMIFERALGNGNSKFRL